MNSNQLLRIIAPTRADVGLILGLIKELAVYERLSHEVEVTEGMIEEALFGERPTADGLLAYWDGQPAGYAVYFINYSTFSGRAGIYLEDLYVRPSARRNGVGRAMLSHLGALCIERGYTRLQWSVLDWNQPAIDFYKTLGAEPLSDWTVFRVSGEALSRLAKGAEPN